MRKEKYVTLASCQNTTRMPKQKAPQRNLLRDLWLCGAEGGIRTPIPLSGTRS